MIEEAEKICHLFYVTWDMSPFLVMDILPCMEVTGRLHFYCMGRSDMSGTPCKSKSDKAVPTPEVHDIEVQMNWSYSEWLASRSSHITASEKSYTFL